MKKIFSFIINFSSPFFILRYLKTSRTFKVITKKMDIVDLHITRIDVKWWNPFREKTTFIKIISFKKIKIKHILPTLCWSSGKSFR